MHQRLSNWRSIVFSTLFLMTIGTCWHTPQTIVWAQTAEKSANESEGSESLPAFSKIAPDATSITGLLSLYQKKTQLYMELSSSHLNTDYIIIISIAKGIGEAPLLGGWSWDFGDDMIWQFRKVDDRIQVVRRNFRYQADQGTPESKALDIAFTDSILYSLPIVAKGPKGGDVIELSSIFMSDLPMISSKALPGFSFARERSTWAKVKALKDNVEIQVAATYAGFGRSNQMETVMDTRGISINVHYSISKLPSSGYTPRLADERVGYFNTVVKNFSKNPEDGNFVRYINRWNLQKLESSSDVSLPKKPIVFWLEKSIPYQYRKPLRDGILEWNKAFEAAGFYNAIEVRQQEDNDTWDPEDVNYNTIRWSTANAGFAIGPSRVNPLTGEILDADIILDVGFLTYWNRSFELYSPDDLTKQFLISPAFTFAFEEQENKTDYPGDDFQLRINESLFHSQQMGLASSFFDMMAHADEENAKGKNEEDVKEKKEKKEDNSPNQSDTKSDDTKDDKSTSDDKDSSPDKKPTKDNKDEPTPKKEQRSYAAEEKKLIQQGLQHLVTHEVGHTLGLRHNFKLSTLNSLEAINQWPESSQYGYMGSIMDYQPVNIMPKGEKQGDYYTTKLGKYDYWVINYGYRLFAGKGTESERDELKNIAAEQTKPEYNYATDEDRTGVSDPLIQIYDLGDSPLAYAQMRVKLFYQILPHLDKRVIKEGESYHKMLSRFNMLMSCHTSAMALATNYIAGMHINRDFRGDKDARPPFQIVPAEQQRQALAFLNKEMFGPESYQIPAELYNYLAPNRWRHWGSKIPARYDVDIHRNILQLQRTFLGALLSNQTVSTLADAAYRVGPEEDLFTTVEMLDSLTGTIFVELEQWKDQTYTNRNPAITSIRRNLQRTYIDLLIKKYLESGISSYDSSVVMNDLARSELEKMKAQLDVALKTKAKLDTFTKAHVKEMSNRIGKVLAANVEIGF